MSECAEGGAVPEWFANALAEAPERGWVTFEGARLETLTWGDPDLPGLLLLHGGAAHADWWSFLAPMLIDRFRVVAFSWSGMGRSDWREHYAIRSFAQEAGAVAEATGLLRDGRKPIWLAHSFGGHPALYAAAHLPECLSALVLVDTGGFPAPGVVESFTYSNRASPVFETEAEALARFRFVPPDLSAPPYVRDFIARRSIAQVAASADAPAGWRWAFDFSMWSRIDRSPEHEELLETAQVPLAFLVGDRSRIMADDAPERIRAAVKGPTPIARIPGAGHHVMIDQPLAFVAALNALLAAWPGWGTACRASRTDD